MLRLFRHGNGIVQALLILACAVLPYAFRAGGAAVPAESAIRPPLSLGATGSWPLFAQAFIMVLLITGSAILLNFLFRRQRLIPYQSGLPGFLLVLALGFALQGSFQPDLMAGILIMTLVTGLLMRVPEADEAFQEIFLTSFLLGMTGFIAAPFIAGVVFLLGFVFVYRIYHWRNWLIILIGQMTAHLFVFTWYFWFDRLPELLHFYQGILPDPGAWSLSGDPLDWWPAALILFAGIYSVGSNLLNLGEKKIIIRGHVILVVWMLIFLILISLSCSDVWLSASLLASLPAAGLLGVRLAEDRRPRLSGLIYYLFIIAYAASFFF